MAIFKRCNCCHQLYQGVQCPSCSKARAKAHAKKRQAENENLKLYGSYQWRQCRQNIRLHYMDFDIWMLGVGIESVCKKPYIHHIVERDEAPELVYRMDNLITVSKDSHEEIHRMYKTDKQAALARIQKGIETFERLYG